MTAAAMPMAVNCPHCDITNPKGGSFCESCGMALPDPHYTGPRVVDAKSLPATGAGGELFGEQLGKQTKTAVNTLLVVGILQLVVGGGGLFMAVNMARGPINQSALIVAMVIVGAISLTFIGLSIWSRFSPLPATIVGLILYSTLIVLNVVNTMAAINTGGPAAANGIGGIGVSWIDILVVILLVRGIQAALTHRRLRDSQSAA